MSTLMAHQLAVSTPLTTVKPCMKQELLYWILLLNSGNQFDTVIFRHALVDIANCGFDFCSKRLWYFQAAEFCMSLVSWWSAISLAQQGLTDSCFYERA